VQLFFATTVLVVSNLSDHGQSEGKQSQGREKCRALFPEVCNCFKKNQASPTTKRADLNGIPYPRYRIERVPSRQDHRTWRRVALIGQVLINGPIGMWENCPSGQKPQSDKTSRDLGSNSVYTEDRSGACTFLRCNRILHCAIRAITIAAPNKAQIAPDPAMKTHE
jgi:hypothetical protein